ncbi:hypothetical protein I4U23_030519 [Adineta vaga]|nr:hypothetical protein I4U23_030519 [Adineta vaga]
MYRALTSSSRTLAQRAIRSTLTVTRLSSTDPEAGSVGGGKDAFGKKEKAEETRWARRYEAEQAEKYRQKTTQGTGQKQPGRQSSASGANPRLAELEAEKRRIDQEIAELKRQNR